MKRLRKSKIEISATSSKRTIELSKEAESSTVAEALVACMRTASTFTAGDQSSPCAILWTDPERQWEGVLEDLMLVSAELFALGDYKPEKRTGPAIWLRCVEGRMVEPALPQGVTPIFYLPGVSKQHLREVEDCPQGLAPLAELQFRGAVYAHPNGKDWTPFAFLSSEHGGLGLEIGRDSATAEALMRSLPAVMKATVAEFRKQRLDADLFNSLLAPDLPRQLLAWLNNPDAVKSAKKENEWTAFCRQCEAEYGFHPDKDGDFRAGELLGGRRNGWLGVWQRFREAPERYPNVVALLERCEPSARGELPLDPEVWPKQNEKEESALSSSLRSLGDAHWKEASEIVSQLEDSHSKRREWVWADLGRAQLALALEHLNLVAQAAQKPLAGATIEEFAQSYVADGWKTDLAAVNALGCCTRPEHDEPVCTALRSIYWPWLDASARNFQRLCLLKPDAVRPTESFSIAKEGQLIIFADGLRFDLAQLLADSLRNHGLEADVSWSFTAYPSVTATAKPLCSPLSDSFEGINPGEDFSVCLKGTTQAWTQERFKALLAESGIQALHGVTGGDPTKKAWLEVGSLDERGHHEGWRLAKLVPQEIEDLAHRIVAQISMGWREVRVVTDHGWLLLPGGLPKVELKRFLVENRWGRCGALKETSGVDFPILGWYWNSNVEVVSPPGVGCFKAGIEYAHGGLSPQEMIVPQLTIRASSRPEETARLENIKWIGLRCRVSVSNAAPGMTVDLRSRAADANSSKVAKEGVMEISADGTASLAVRDTSDEGAACVVVLLTASGEVIHSLPTIIGVTR